MTNHNVSDYVSDLEQKVARLEGELHATLARLAAIEASDEQRRVEFEATRADLAVAQVDLAHVQRRAKDQHEGDQRRVAALEAELVTANERCRIAERERSAVITALGRRARKHLQLND